MLDLTTKALPNAITVGGRAYLLNTDYRYWLKFIRDVAKSMRTRSDFDVSYLFESEMPSYVDVEVLMEWAQPPRELPRPLGSKSEVIAFDFDIDADLIYSAFMQQYGIDLIETDMHWHKFLALMQGIGSDTKLGEVIGYRSYEKSDKKYEDQMTLLRRMWEIEPPLTAEQQEDIDELNNLFD